MSESQSDLTDSGRRGSSDARPTLTGADSEIKPISHPHSGLGRQVRTPRRADARLGDAGGYISASMLGGENCCWPGVLAFLSAFTTAETPQAQGLGALNTPPAEELLQMNQ